MKSCSQECCTMGNVTVKVIYDYLRGGAAVC